MPFTLDYGCSRSISQALLNLPDKIGVTANLNLNYRAPTRADQVWGSLLLYDMLC